MNNKSDLKRNELGDSEFVMPVAPPPTKSASVAKGKEHPPAIQPVRNTNPVIPKAVLWPTEACVSGKQLDLASPKSWSAAAEDGDALAMALLGDALCWGGFFTRGITRDVLNGIRFLERSASLGHPLGLFMLSRAQRNLPGHRTNPEIADQTEKRAVNAGFFDHNGDGGAVWWMAEAIAYREGRIISLDIDRQLDLIRKSLASDYTDAWTGYAFCLIGGEGIRQDLEEGIKWLKRAAEAQNGTAMLHLANCYRNGTGVAKSPQAALEWYEKSALVGEDSALNSIGFCIRNGIGCKRDPARAFQYYRRAAESGNPSGLYNVGFSYEKGIGVKKDVMGASEWYARAAELGHEKALLALKRTGMRK